MATAKKGPGKSGGASAPRPPRGTPAEAAEPVVPELDAAGAPEAGEAEMEDEALAAAAFDDEDPEGADFGDGDLEDEDFDDEDEDEAPRGPLAPLEGLTRCGFVALLGVDYQAESIVIFTFVPDGELSDGRDRIRVDLTVILPAVP